MFYLPLATFFPLIISFSLIFGIILPGQETIQVELNNEAKQSVLRQSYSLQALEEIFTQHEYQWPPQAAVPLLIVDTLPAGLDAIEVKRKKSLFFRTLLPIVLSENKIIHQQRQWLLSAFAKGKIKPESDTWKVLQEIAVQYRVEGELNDPQTRELFLKRVDEIPTALVLVQAAKESGWGTSRFTREANNLFGEWTYRPGEGLIPLARDEGARHSIRIFANLRSSVKSYLHNINMGHAYDVLRQLRADMRAQHKPLNALELSAGLIRYSERGQAYVDEIRQLIRINGLQQLVGLRLVN